MRKEIPLVVCTFGWGQVFRLYHDYLSVKGKYYLLNDLTDIQVSYQHKMGISSARLELHFGKKKLTFRGIAAIDDVQKVVQYLTPWCMRFDVPEPDTDQNNLRDDENLALPNSQPKIQERPITQHHEAIKDLSEANTLPIETPPWRRNRQETWIRRQRSTRSKRLHAIRSLQEEQLPVVPVPVRLLAEEQAHYVTSATLCGEPIGEPPRSTFPAQDSGTLILTNKRMIFIGRKSQIVLDFTYLLQVSRCYDAIAFEAKHWQKRMIFEVYQPLECSLYLECILEQFRHSREAQMQRNLDNYEEQEDQFAEDLEVEHAVYSRGEAGPRSGTLYGRL